MSISYTLWAVKFVNTAEMTDAARKEAYLKEAAVTASVTHHGVHGVFGSNKYPERDFGVGMPALRIEGFSDRDPGDIFPHFEGNSCVAISEFLNRTEASRQFRTGVAAPGSDVSEPASHEISRDNSKALEEMLTNKARD